MDYRQAWQQCTASGIMKNLNATDVFLIAEDYLTFHFKGHLCERK